MRPCLSTRDGERKGAGEGGKGREEEGRRGRNRERGGIGNEYPLSVDNLRMELI